jgi:hypothetical protein
MSDGPRANLTIDPSLEVLWHHALDHWDEDKAHAAFLQHCDATNQLPEAAARYRGMAADHTRAEVAEQKLRAVAALAVAKLETQRMPPAGAPKLLTLIAVVFVVATLFCLLYVYNMFR